MQLYIPNIALDYFSLQAFSDLFEQLSLEVKLDAEEGVIISRKSHSSNLEIENQFLRNKVIVDLLPQESQIRTSIEAEIVQHSLQIAYGLKPP